MNVPNHIAIILDGNGRWAKERGMPRTYGHVKGCANLDSADNIQQCRFTGTGWTEENTDFTFFHRKLETLQRRSGSTDETVPRLS